MIVSPHSFRSLQLQVFDLTNPDKTHSTGPKSTKLDEITSVQWNPSVAHILAASSSSGYTSVWDLRQKREVLSLAYGGGAATGMQGAGRNMGGFGNMQVGNKRGMSSVVWHPNNVSLAKSSDELISLCSDAVLISEIFGGHSLLD